MESVLDVGRLNQRLVVLEFVEVESGVWQWSQTRKTWGNVQEERGRNLFSAVGVGTRGAALVMRRQRLDESNALLWQGKHLHLTAVTARGRGHLDVSAAVVAPLPCLARKMENGKGAANRPVRTEVGRISFPGVLTEKFVGYQRDGTHAESTVTFVLVTPKEIALEAGWLVDCAGETHNVQKCHMLGAHQNEYEIALGKDV